MKFSGFTMTLLLVVGILLGGMGLILEFESSYVDTGIVNTTKYASDFNISLGNSINDSFIAGEQIAMVETVIIPLQIALKDVVDDEGAGFFSASFTLLETIPKVFIKLPGAILQLVGIINTIFQEASKEIGMPFIIMSLLSLSLLIWVLFKGIEAFRRYPV